MNDCINMISFTLAVFGDLVASHFTRLNYH
jgi:hypothetical protein